MRVGGKVVELKSGDLRDPIALARSKRVPDTQVGATGFITTLTPYLDAWAKVFYGDVTLLEKENSDDKETHAFAIRHVDSLSIEARDVIRWKDGVFDIMRVGVVERSYGIKFYVIYTTQRDQVSNNNATVDETGTVDDNTVTPVTDPFWTD